MDSRNLLHIIDIKQGLNNPNHLVLIDLYIDTLSALPYPSAMANRRIIPWAEAMSE